MKVYSGEMEQRKMSLEAHLHAVPLCELSRTG